MKKHTHLILTKSKLEDYDPENYDYINVHTYLDRKVVGVSTGMDNENIEAVSDVESLLRDGWEEVSHDNSVILGGNYVFRRNKAKPE